MDSTDTHASEPDVRKEVSPGDVLLFPWTPGRGNKPNSGFGTFRVFVSDSHWRIPLQIHRHILLFDTPEEAILHWESLGAKPTELQFEPDFTEIVKNGRVLPSRVWTQRLKYDIPETERIAETTLFASAMSVRKPDILHDPPRSGNPNPDSWTSEDPKRDDPNRKTSSEKAQVRRC